MTDKEKAIVMAHTGICMLTGDKFQIFHKYVEDIMNRPIMTHELGWLEDEIKEKSKADFMALCANESNSEIPKNSPTETLISLDVYKEVAKERDIAIQQLHELGYEFGQKIEPTTKNDLALIHTEGLDEEIRCTMCTNSMKSDRGCDGSCVVDKDMYKAVMDAIEKRIQPTTKNDLGIEYHKQNIQAYAHDFGVSEEQAEKELEVTTKNDVPHCQHTDKEIAKSFIEDVEVVKDQLSCGEQMDFPDTFDEFAKDYGFRDKKEIYTIGSELIPVFRVKQWLEHISTTKNDLGVDCISREKVLKLIYDYKENHSYDREHYPINYGTLLDMIRWVRDLPPVTPIRPKGHWITRPHVYGVAFCSECGFELKINNTNYCPNCGSRNEVEE